MDEFTSRRHAKEHQPSAIPGTAPAVYRAALHKPGRAGRLYRIDAMGRSWRCEVWLGAALHRTALVDTPTHRLALQQQFAREVAELVADVWTVEV